MTHFALRLFALMILCTVGSAHAQPRTTSDAVPPTLAPWVPWVLATAGDARCSQVEGQPRCSWPGALALDVAGNAASFTMRVFVERELPVKLPGSSDHWPIDVKVDGAPAVLREPGGVPTVDLARGAHTLTGRFVFAEPPSTLSVPADIGTLSLQRDGVAVAQPRREANGLLWIEEGASEDAREQSLSLSVQRRIEDAVPLRVITRILIRAAGKSREIAFDNVLVQGARPIALHASVPAQLAPNGALRLQIQGGSHRVEIVSVIDAPSAQLSAPKLPAPWPEQETWVFRADDVLRHVELSGPPQVDAARTELEADWRGLPTFLVSPAQPLALEVRRRGEQEPAPNQLRLARSLWLDLDGDGYTVRDELSGAMHQGFRLDLEQGTLGRAVVDGEDALITRRAKQSGVELRTGALALTTEWRLEHGQRDLPAVGYNEDVDHLTTTLHLPPGYMLLGTVGTDSAQGTWLDRWDLFDFFFVLAIALAVAKLAGAPWGVLALLALVLAQHEPDAPAGSWFFLLGCCALVRALAGNAGKAATFARLLLGVSTIVLLLAWVPFAVQQVRSALYPQLAEQNGAQTSFVELAMSAPAPAGGEALAKRGRAYDVAKSLAEEAVGSALPSAPKPDTYSVRQLIDPSAIVQTGPGIPNWSFQQFTLGWSGPVTRAERVQLWLVPPFVTRLWALASALLSGLLLFGMLNATRSADPPAPSGSAPELAAATLCALLLCAPSARADALEPSPALLAELRQRLLKPPACTPDCVAVPSLSLSLSAHRLDATVELHAAEGAVYRAPGPLSQWAVERMHLDGADAFQGARLEDGFLYVRVPAGIHRLELSGPIPASQAWSLALGSPAPHRVAAQGPGWVVEGLHADGSAEPNLELRPVVTRDDAEQGAQPLVQWLEVQRELELGLRFELRTTITRLGPATDGVTVRLPLLPDESVNEAGLRSEDGSVLINLPRDRTTLSFHSTLTPRAKLQLTAAQPMVDGALRHPYSERWVIRPGPLYRVSMSGLPALAQTDESGQYAPSYRPYPGEQLTVFAERLAAEAGASVTIDRAELALRPGSRSEEAKLTLSVRNSRGSTERITLPPGAKLASVVLDGHAHPARLKQDVVEIPLAPGTHAIEVTTQRTSELSFAYAPARPKVGRPLSNVRINVTLPPDRWLLATGGPAWGPAILWWGHLVLVLVVALALGRVPGSPLKSHQWALLGFGLGQVETPVALIVVGWFFALAYRERDRITGVRLFYLVQALLVLFTLVALSCLVYAVHQGLLVPPDMQVQGMLSSQNFLQWYVDRTPGELPEVTVWSAPLWIYKSLMLIWALWLALGLVQWLRWGWSAFRKGGLKRKAPFGALHGRGMRGTPIPPGAAGAADASGRSADSERAGVS